MALARLLVLSLAVAVLSGCATKRDLKDVRDQLISLQMRQDTIYLLLQQENRAVRDSVFQVMNELIRTRGDLRNQLLAMEQQLIQIQELQGQSSRVLADLRQQNEARQQEASSDPPRLGGGAAGVREPVEAGQGSDAEALYAVGSQQLERGAPGAARMAFEQILREHGSHPRAPDAQFGIAESLALDERFDEAIQSYERVVSLYPDSPRAASALYRAGVVSRDQGNFSAARGYFQRVVSGYPRSDEARLAGEALQRLPR